MRKLFQADGNLTKLGRRTGTTLAGVYALAIVLLCFLPQTWYPQYKDFSTPGIIQIGRLYLLPTPFNSIVNGNKVDSLGDFGWIILQNATNIFFSFLSFFCFFFFGRNGGALKQFFLIHFVSVCLLNVHNCYLTY